MIQVFIPSQLTAYTDGVTRVEASGATVGGVLDDLDRRFPGLKFRVIDEQDRVRKHMRMFIGRAETRPRLKVAMVTPASARRPPRLPMKPGLSRLLT